MNSFSIKTQYPLLAFCNTQESQQRKEILKKNLQNQNAWKTSFLTIPQFVF